MNCPRQKNNDVSFRGSCRWKTPIPTFSGHIYISLKRLINEFHCQIISQCRKKTERGNPVVSPGIVYYAQSWVMIFYPKPGPSPFQKSYFSKSYYTTSCANKTSLTKNSFTLSKKRNPLRNLYRLV